MAVAIHIPEQEVGTGAEKLDPQDQGRVEVHTVEAWHLYAREQLSDTIKCLQNNLLHFSKT